MYLFLDCEMGGIGREYSLLTTYLAVLDVNFQKIGELSLAVKPNDGIYKVCGQAMEVNKIDLVKHDKIAIPYKDGGTKLYQFLSKYSDCGKLKLIPCGHGIRGDLDVLIEHLIGRNTLENFTSYRMLDTSSVAQFLKSCGLLPDTISGSLQSLALHFNILEKRACEINVEYITWKNDQSGNGATLHTAETDTLVTIAVMKSLMELIKKQ